jgi:hypothetical protein
MSLEKLQHEKYKSCMNILAISSTSALLYFSWNFCTTAGSTPAPGGRPHAPAFDGSGIIVTGSAVLAHVLGNIMG